MDRDPCLIDYPYVLVRFRCTRCKRAGQSKLARLAEKFGADCPLEELLDIMAADCHLVRRPPLGRKPKKMGTYCGIYLPDYEYHPRPPDLPRERMTVVRTDEDAA